MKRIKILGIVLFSLFLIYTFMDFYKGFSDAYYGSSAGWRDATDVEYDGGKVSYVNGIDVVELDNNNTICDSIYNSHLGCKVPARINELTTQIYIDNFTYYVCRIVEIIVAILGLYGIICLIKMYISICKGSVLTSKNASRLRKFMYFFMAFKLVKEIQRYVFMVSIENQLEFKGMKLAEDLTMFDWTDMFIMIFLTEIFALAVKLKEEQDLTI